MPPDRDDKPALPPKKPAPRQTVAVALSYDPDQGDAAPRVVATGRGRLAEQILALAFEHGVKVREDADLTQILSAVEIDSIIPLEAFMAVAEILAYVYKANQCYPSFLTGAAGQGPGSVRP